MGASSVPAPLAAAVAVASRPVPANAATVTVASRPVPANAATVTVAGRATPAAAVAVAPAAATQPCATLWLPNGSAAVAGRSLSNCCGGLWGAARLGWVARTVALWRASLAGGRRPRQPSSAERRRRQPNGCKHVWASAPVLATAAGAAAAAAAAAVAAGRAVLAARRQPATLWAGVGQRWACLPSWHTQPAAAGVGQPCWLSAPDTGQPSRLPAPYARQPRRLSTPDAGQPAGRLSR